MQLAVQHVHMADCSAILLAISLAKKKHRTWGWPEFKHGCSLGVHFELLWSSYHFFCFYLGFQAWESCLFSVAIEFIVTGWFEAQIPGVEGIASDVRGINVIHFREKPHILFSQVPPGEKLDTMLTWTLVIKSSLLPHIFQHMRCCAGNWNYYKNTDQILLWSMSWCKSNQIRLGQESYIRIWPSFQWGSFVGRNIR